jgi:hypothetical protein
MSETDKVGQTVVCFPGAEPFAVMPHSDNELGMISRLGSLTDTRPVPQSRAAARTATICALVATAVENHQ